MSHHTFGLQVMTVLLRNHGLNLMGVKTNLYTSIGKPVPLALDTHSGADAFCASSGIDSKHPSGVSSTVCPPTDILPE